MVVVIAFLASLFVVIFVLVVGFPWRCLLFLFEAHEDPSPKFKKYYAR